MCKFTKTNPCHVDAMIEVGVSSAPAGRESSRDEVNSQWVTI